MKTFLFFCLLSLKMYAQSWTALTPFPGIARDDGVAVEVEDKAYVGTGLKTGWSLAGDFFVLDLATNTWSSIASMPSGTERQYACAFKGPFSFYVFGGDGSGGVLNTLYKYSVSSNTWTQMSSKPGAGVYGASVIEFGDKVVLLGGKFSGGTVNQEVWEYSISNDTWTQKNNMPNHFGGRWRGCTTAFQGKGYLLFGIDANTNWRKEFLEYDPQNDTWQLLPSPPSTPSRAYASMQTLNNQLILFAGMDSLNNYTNSVSYFHPATSAWTAGPNLPANARRGGMSWALNNLFYYTCGLEETETRLNETWMLDVPVGLAENESFHSIKAGPNPFKEELFIYTNPGQAELKLKMKNGLGIDKLNPSDMEFLTDGILIHTEKLESGIYFLEVEIGKNSSSIRKVWKP